ncbi:MAG: hypothetical protein R3C11_14650 [Planctomycetaceae bacterium]
MTINGGIRFLPIYGESGSGKSSASRELPTHMPSVTCQVLSREDIETKEQLVKTVTELHKYNNDKTLVLIVDQYEENVKGKESIPTQFIEYLSLLDRDEFRHIPAIFLWLTTSKTFRDALVEATTRNKRILQADNFEIYGPQKVEWPKIIEETFSFHNSEKQLADYTIIESDLTKLSHKATTIGECIEDVGRLLGEHLDDLEDISEYLLVILWPVADSARNQRVLQFSRPRDGYKLNWDAWYAELNNDDKRTLPLKELNRTRLYFDCRVIPLRTADLHKLCLDLDDDSKSLADTYLNRFRKTHFFLVISDNWAQYDFNPLRERESQRSLDAKKWYEGVTAKPVLLGKRISKILSECGLDCKHEFKIKTNNSSVIADIFVETSDNEKPKKIIELKAYATSNTTPSAIKEQIKTTLKKHAQLAGFLSRQ